MTAVARSLWTAGLTAFYAASLLSGPVPEAFVVVYAAGVIVPEVVAGALRHPLRRWRGWS